jgi:transcriptional regulator with XRE-family HTH domain
MPKAKGSISTPALRFHHLVVQLLKEDYSVTEIAEMLGIKRPQVSKWKNLDPSIRQDIGGDTLYQVSRRLKISGDYLLGDHPPTEERSYKEFDLARLREQRQTKEVARKNSELEKRIEMLEELVRKLLDATKNSGANDGQQPPRVIRK